MTYTKEEKCCKPSFFINVVATCYDLLLRPLNKYSLDTFIHAYNDDNNNNNKNIIDDDVFYTQEDEENNYNATNTSNFYNIDLQQQSQQSSKTNKRKQLDTIYEVPYPSNNTNKLPRSSTYSKLDSSTIKPQNQPERRRCASMPHSYPEIHEHNKNKEKLPIIQCQHCHKTLRNDIVFVGSDMTFCSIHCRRNTFHSFII
jgi:hypothetical protein